MGGFPISSLEEEEFASVSVSSVFEWGCAKVGLFLCLQLFHIRDLILGTGIHMLTRKNYLPSRITF